MDTPLTAKDDLNALDKFALLLVEQNHEWSPTERMLYDLATSIIKRYEEQPVGGMRLG